MKHVLISALMTAGIAVAAPPWGDEGGVSTGFADSRYANVSGDTFTGQVAQTTYDPTTTCTAAQHYLVPGGSGANDLVFCADGSSGDVTIDREGDLVVGMTLTVASGITMTGGVIMPSSSGIQWGGSTAGAIYSPRSSTGTNIYVASEANGANERGATLGTFSTSPNADTVLFDGCYDATLSTCPFKAFADGDVSFAGRIDTSKLTNCTVATNAVTCSASSGQITDDGTDINTDTTRADITWTNTAIASTSIVHVSVCSARQAGTAINVHVVPGSGSATISLRNVGTSNFTDAGLKLCFTVSN